MGRKNNKKKAKGRPKGPDNPSRDSSSAGLRPPPFWDARPRRGNSHDRLSTVYSRYKKATNRFVDYMAKARPSEMEASANSLMAASDALANTDHDMERSILNDLKLAIRVRTRVAKSVYDGGDEGHKYFLEVLTYCWSVLNSLPKTATKEKKDYIVDSAVVSEEEGPSNPYDALAEDDQEEDVASEEEENIFPSEPVKRPSLPKGSEPLSLDELIYSDERHDAILFLLSLNEIMGNIAGLYRTSVLVNFVDYQEHGYPDSTIVGKLVEAAAATNLAIQQVQQLEMDLEFHHEHLNTPYRVIATVVFPTMAQQLMAIVRQHSRKEGCTEKDVAIYLGDCLESCFRDPNDPNNRKEKIAIDFCNKWQVDMIARGKFLKHFNYMQFSMVQEVPIGQEKSPQIQAELKRVANGQIFHSHSWIKTMPWIGGDRAIHHTLRLLQGFRDVIRKIPKFQRIEPNRGHFGKSPWVANALPGTKIRDLDELFMTDIMAKWVMICRQGIIGAVSKLPFEDEICPLFGLMRKYVLELQKPVSWSITFGFHAMLTAILEVEPLLDKLAEVSKGVFDAFFKQIEWAKAQAAVNSESFPNSNICKSVASGLTDMAFLQNLGLTTAFGERALWNPLCAGTIFSFLNYFGNYNGGCTMIDHHGQLRITLHLFHALLANGILKTGEIPMLDCLYDGFRNSKAIWSGRSLPQKGEFVQRFWTCMGNNAVDAARVSEEAKNAIQGVLQAPNTNTVRPRSSMKNTTRRDKKNHVPIEASELSKSFRRICHRDFHDVVDRYHTPEQRRKHKDTEAYRFRVNANDTMDAIKDEQMLMSLNFSVCGVFIEQFVIALGERLQWGSLLKDSYAAGKVGKNDERRAFLFAFAENLLGALDFCDDPFEYTFMDQPLGKASSEFMVDYFTRQMDSSLTLWFQPIHEQD